MDDQILAIVTPNREKVSGGAPVFHAETPEEQDALVKDLARALRADVVALRNGIQILLPVQRHQSK